MGAHVVTPISCPLGGRAPCVDDLCHGTSRTLGLGAVLRPHVCIRCGHPVRWHVYHDARCYTPDDCLPCTCARAECEFCETGKCVEQRW